MAAFRGNECWCAGLFNILPRFYIECLVVAVFDSATLSSCIYKCVVVVVVFFVHFLSWLHQLQNWADVRTFFLWCMHMHTHTHTHSQHTHWQLNWMHVLCRHVYISVYSCDYVLLPAHTCMTEYNTAKCIFYFEYVLLNIIVIQVYIMVLVLNAKVLENS